MKIARLERFGAGKGRRLSTFLFVLNGHEHGDSLYLGCETGQVSVFHLPETGHSMKQVKEEVMSLERPQLSHSVRVTCLLHTHHWGSSGLLFSGSSDRSVKVWTSIDRAMIQSLQHSATVSGLADGCDGSVLSITMDGFLRVWSPQRDRHMMLNPFFECTFNVNVLPGATREAWISALELNSYGYWGAYVGESDGSISLYRKNVDTSDMEEHVASASCPLFRSKRWEKLHSLSIVCLKLLPDEGYLVSLSSDGCCKVCDASMGAVILSFDNPRKCVYTGCSWSSAESTLYLTDELGFLQAYNVGREKNVDSVQVTRPSLKQQTKILSSHSEQALVGIAAYKTPRQFFVLTLPFSTKTVQATMSTNPLAPGKPRAAKETEEAMASYGEVHLISVITSACCVEFIGHEDSVLGISINTLWDAKFLSKEEEDGGKGEGGGKASSSSFTSAAIKSPKKSKATTAVSARDTQQTLRVSKEEEAFFSVGFDFTIRCWDEFDATESYQFRSKGASAFSCVRVIWNMNLLATGYENGALRLWNSDAGSHVESRALKHSLTCITEARNSRSHLLVGADFSGQIAVWNLTQFRQNPVVLPSESLFQSHHDPEDPGVLSLAFHKKSNTFFSGGVDRVIKVWRLNVEIAGSLRSHNESVCCLECTDNFLLSGDEGGEIVLWRILDSSVVSSSASASLPLLSAVCRFYCAAASGPTRSIVAMQEINAGKVCVVQAGKSGRSYIWDVWLQPNKKRNPDMESLVASTSSMEFVHALSIATDAVDPAHPVPPAAAASRFRSQGNNNKRQSVAVSRISMAERERQPEEEFRILHDANPDVYISVSVSSCGNISHEEHEATCVQLLCSDVGSPQSLYIGTAAGLILKYLLQR